MKKYLFIVLLVGVWSGELDEELSENTITDEAKQYVDDNWNLKRWWYFTQSGGIIISLSDKKS
tara:strand:+ start:217 stop:405 length:189 start_codon:yes stop_codon:yes gene_type:complete